MTFPFTIWRTQSEASFSLLRSNYLFEDKGKGMTMLTEYVNSEGFGLFCLLLFSIWDLLLFFYLECERHLTLTEGLPVQDRLWRNSIREACCHFTFVKRKWTGGWNRTIPRVTGELVLVNVEEARDRHWWTGGLVDWRKPREGTNGCLGWIPV